MARIESHAIMRDAYASVTAVVFVRESRVLWLRRVAAVLLIQLAKRIAPFNVEIR